jgi:hypothetical protein
MSSPKAPTIAQATISRWDRLQDFPAFPTGLKSVSTEQPALDVGGDLYDFFLLTRLFFVSLAGDVRMENTPAHGNDSVQDFGNGTSAG